MKQQKHRGTSWFAPSEKSVFLVFLILTWSSAKEEIKCHQLNLGRWEEESWSLLEMQNSSQQKVSVSQCPEKHRAWISMNTSGILSTTLELNSEEKPMTALTNCLWHGELYMSESLQKPGMASSEGEKLRFLGLHFLLRFFLFTLPWHYSWDIVLRFFRFLMYLH